MEGIAEGWEDASALSCFIRSKRGSVPVILIFDLIDLSRSLLSLTLLTQFFSSSTGCTLIRMV